MIKAIIFDFDGVIADTFEINYSLNKELFRDLTEQEYKEAHTGNVFQSSKMKYDPKELELLFEKQKSKYNKDHLFPLKEVLNTLYKKYLLLIISSTIDENIRYLLNLGEIDNYFKDIYGATRSSSKIKKFKMIFEDFRLNPKECILITDTTGDIKEAREANVDSIAVTWGFLDRKILQEEKPLAIIDRPEDLIQTIISLS